MLLFFFHSRANSCLPTVYHHSDFLLLILIFPFHVFPTSLCTSALTGILSQQGMWVRHPLKRFLFLIKLLQQCSQDSVCTEYVLWRAQSNSPLSSSLIQPSVLMGDSWPGHSCTHTVHTHQRFVKSLLFRSSPSYFTSLIFFFLPSLH